MRIIFLLFTTIIAVSACNKKVKETIGISTPGPNEYQVQRGKALEVPPHYYLPNPQTSKQINQINKAHNLNSGEQALMEEINAN